MKPPAAARHLPLHRSVCVDALHLCLFPVRLVLIAVFTQHVTADTAVNYWARRCDIIDRFVALDLIGAGLFVGK